MGVGLLLALLAQTDIPQRSLYVRSWGKRGYLAVRPRGQLLTLAV